MILGHYLKKALVLLPKKNKEKYKISNISVVEFNIKKVCLKPISCHNFQCFYRDFRTASKCHFYAKFGTDF